MIWSQWEGDLLDRERQMFLFFIKPFPNVSIVSGGVVHTILAVSDWHMAVTILIQWGKFENILIVTHM